MHPSAPPSTVVPAGTGPASADPDTARWLTAATRRVTHCLLAVAGALVVTLAALAVTVGYPTQQGWAVQVISLGLLAMLVFSLPIWPLLPVLRHRTVLAGASWRPVTAKVVRGGPDRRLGPSMLLVAGFDQQAAGEPVHLRVPGLPWPLQRVVLGTGRIWLCGPDRRGRAVVRVDGLSGPPLPARLARSVGPGTAPALTVPTGGRPIDDPQVRWLLGVARQRLRLLATMAVLLAGVGGASMIPGDPLTEPIVGIALLVTVLGAAVWLRDQVRALRQLVRLVPLAGSWTPVPAQLLSWAPGTTLVGPATVAGAGLTIRVPYATASLVANLTASQTLWLAGEPVPGSAVAVGVPGLPVLGLARISS